MDSLKFALPAISIGAGFQMFRQVVEEFDNVSDNATRAGVDLKQFMQIVGTLDSEDTALATEALKKLRKSLAELQSGDAGKIAQFKLAGLDPNNFQGNNLADSLQRIAKAWASTTDPLKKFNIEFAAFGKTGVEVAAALDKLAKAGDGPNRFAGLDPEGFEAMKRRITELENRWFNLKANLAQHFAGDDEHARIDRKALEREKEIEDIKKPKLPPEQQAILDMRRGKTAEFLKLMGDMEADAKKDIDKLEPLRAKAREQGEEIAKMFRLANDAEKFRKQMPGGRMAQDLGQAIEKIKGAFFERNRLEGIEKEKSVQKQRADEILGRTRFNKMPDFQSMLGRMVRDKVAAAGQGFMQTSPTLSRGSAEEGSFRAQFEQRREGVKTMESQMIDIFKQALAAEKQQEKEMQKIGKILQDKFPIFKMAAMGQ